MVPLAHVHQVLQVLDRKDAARGVGGIVHENAPHRTAVLHAQFVNMFQIAFPLLIRLESIRHHGRAVRFANDLVQWKAGLGHQQDGIIVEQCRQGQLEGTAAAIGNDYRCSLD